MLRLGLLEDLLREDLIPLEATEALGEHREDLGKGILSTGAAMGLTARWGSDNVRGPFGGR